MFGNSFLDSLPPYDVLQNIVDKCDNENAINSLTQSVKAFVIIKKYLQSNQGQQLMIVDVIAGTGVNFDTLWLILFLIAFNQGFQSIALNSEVMTYNG